MDRRSFLKQGLLTGISGILLSQMPFLNRLEGKNIIDKMINENEQLAKFWENINDSTVR
ncbi:MAG: hypothetical protein WCS63_07430 [Bacteroidales bacterium]